MSREELEAEQSLAALSQATNYIFQWQEKKIKKPLHLHIKEEKHEEQFQHTPAIKKPKEQRKVPVIKEVSEKYDLKKWEGRAQAINKIQFPVFDVQEFQLRYVRPKCKINLGPSLNEGEDIVVERKQSINKKIIQAVQHQYMMKKLKRFQKKLQSSKKNVFKQESEMRVLKYLPKNLAGRRSTILEKDKSQELNKRISNKSQIEKFKKELGKNIRKFSLPNLFKF